MKRETQGNLSLPPELLPLQDEIVYGPLQSRRLGRSLGINLLSTTCKVCSMNCCYCQYGWTDKFTNPGRGLRSFFPSLQEVALALRKAFKSGCKVDYLTFSGNGEPTLHPDFPAIVDLVIEMKGYLRCNAKLAILSNSTTCGDPAILAALQKIDQPMMKLDAGNQRTYARVNRGKPPVQHGDIIAGLRQLKTYIIQSMFVRGAIDNSTGTEVASWIETLKGLSPSEVQIYTLDRKPANSKLQKVSPDRLRKIAGLAAEATSLKVAVF